MIGMTTQFGTASDTVGDRVAKSGWLSVLVNGVLTLALGAAVLAWPGSSLIVAGALFGVYLLVSGVAQVVSAFGTVGTAGLRVLAFISGGLAVVLGVMCFRSSLQSVVMLAIWIGAGWLFRGITLIVSAAADSRAPARGTQIFLGIMSVLAGVVVIEWPLTSSAVLTIVAGSALLVLGLAEAIFAFVVRGKANR